MRGISAKPIEQYIAKTDALYVANPFRQIAVFQSELVEKNQKIAVKKTMDSVAKMQAEKHEALLSEQVLNIIEDETAKPENLNSKKTTKQIVDAAKDCGADPVTIACLAKHESKFDQSQNGSSGKGMMQITRISITDMYQKGRESVYHEKLGDIKAKYKTSDALYKAIQQNSDLNLQVGTILFKAKLDSVNGNLPKALESYNGSPRAKSYSKEVMQMINNYKRIDTDC